MDKLDLDEGTLYEMNEMAKRIAREKEEKRQARFQYLKHYKEIHKDDEETILKRKISKFKKEMREKIIIDELKMLREENKILREYIEELEKDDTNIL